MNIQKVKQGAKITLYNGVYMSLLGIFFAVFSRFNMESNFKAISLIWQLFVKYNPKIAFLFHILNIVVGSLLVAIGIIIVYLSYFIIKRKEKMTWVILFISGLISWAGLLVSTILIKNYLLVSLTFIGWIMFLIGMLLPIRYYLEKNYKEY
ncbi:MAG: hypothetical protein ACP5OG_03195 [Candidatus Nanoarchaeia archaeon]